MWIKCNYIYIYTYMQCIDIYIYICQCIYTTSCLPCLTWFGSNFSIEAGCPVKPKYVLFVNQEGWRHPCKQVESGEYSGRSWWMMMCLKMGGVPGQCLMPNNRENYVSRLLKMKNNNTSTNEIKLDLNRLNGQANKKTKLWMVVVHDLYCLVVLQIKYLVLDWTCFVLFAVGYLGWAGLTGHANKGKTIHPRWRCDQHTWHIPSISTWHLLYLWRIYASVYLCIYIYT